MKRFLMFVFALTFGLIFLTEQAQSVPNPDSLRSYGTAGMFKEEYDRLSDNPAYVGAKLNYLEYQKSLTKEKTNIFTILDGLDSDAATEDRFLLGGIGNPGFGFIGGIGGYAEIAMQTTPQSVSWSPSVGNTTVNFGGSGTAEGSDVYLTYDGGTGTYSERETLEAKEESYLNDSHLNGKLALGGISLGSITLGISFERNTDSGYGTGEYTDKGSYSYARTRLSDMYDTETRVASFNNKETDSATNYLTNIGAVIPIGGFISEIELIADIDYLQYSVSEKNSYNQTNTITGNYILNYTGGDWWDGTNVASDKEKRDGLQYGLTVQTRENIGTWAALTYLSYTGGGLTPNKDRTTTFMDDTNNYSFTYQAGSTQVNTQTETGTYKYSGSGISLSRIGLGATMRKQMTNNVLFGLGFSYDYENSENKYKKTTTYRRVTTVNDGDGIVESADLTTTRTGSYTDNYTDTDLSHSLTFRLGMEYQATETITWRMGGIHTTEVSYYESKYSRGSVSDLYDDVDADDVAGNETDSDSIVGNTAETTIGSYSFDTTNRSDRDYRNTNSQTNTLYVGMGYAVDNFVQLNALWSQGGAGFSMDMANWYMSATIVF